MKDLLFVLNVMVNYIGEIKLENEALNFGAEEKEWKDESNKKLGERESPYRVYNKNLVMIGFLLVILIFIGVFYYLGTNDYFKSYLSVNNTCESTICPNITCPNLFCGDCNLTIIGYNNSYIYNNTYYNNT